jgi:hypothetical protein
MNKKLKTICLFILLAVKGYCIYAQANPELEKMNQLNIFKLNESFSKYEPNLKFVQAHDNQKEYLYDNFKDLSLFTISENISFDAVKLTFENSKVAIIDFIKIFKSNDHFKDALSFHNELIEITSAVFGNFKKLSTNDNSGIIIVCWESKNRVLTLTVNYMGLNKGSTVHFMLSDAKIYR